MMILILLNNVLMKIIKKIEKLQTYDFSYFLGKDFFGDDG